ncbi:MAG: hypothetical protein A2Y10_00355 [Planctomycetes bacterium GWF2_41_51]|nr:MAG: hypothetical protein A2Y10_00355 [Planctomycetes bacterium GWF2_41_51]
MKNYFANLHKNFKNPHTLQVSIILFFVLLSYAHGFDIVTNGKPAAVIVIPDKAVDCVKRAAHELQYYVKEASGANLDIVNESVLTNKKQRSCIFLGDCKATAQANIIKTKPPRNGFIIKSIGSNLFLTGQDTPYEWYIFDAPTNTGTLLAVYNFLDNQLGVRWLWPGKLGEVVPKASNIRIERINQTITPPLISSRFYAYSWKAGWANQQISEQFKKDEDIWQQRHYFSWDPSVSAKHSFETYWERFNKTHPEFFNLLPDGTRRSDPHYVGGGSPMYISMCISEPNLWNQIVEDWKASRTPQNPNIFVSENDTPGRCCCPRCMSWDVPDKSLHIPWDKRLEYAKRDFANASDGWYKNLGNLTDRYTRFYMEVLKLAQKIDPNVYVIGFAYSNYTTPPLQTKLDKHIIIYYVGDIMYPWTDEKVQKDKDMWKAWANTGASLSWRPNFTWDGHNMPIFFARKFGNLFSYFYKNSLLGTYYDSDMGQYSTQGPNLYVLARMQYAIEKPVDEILDEYYSAFGPAKQQIKEYFSYWEKISDAVTDETLDTYAAQVKTPEGGHYGHFYMIADAIFTPEVMAKGHAILNKAIDAAKSDDIASARVDYLMKGLKNAELTLATQAAYRSYKTSGNISAYQEAVKILDDYRASVESDYICNMGFLYSRESESWDRSFYIFSKAGIEFDPQWKFMWDPNDEGVNKEWFSENYDESLWFDIGVDSTWEEQAIGKQWKQQHGNDYDGFGWYRNKFVVPTSEKHQKYTLAFGAVDEACKIWINGQLVLDRPYPYEGDSSSWSKGFEVDITNFVKFEKPNMLAVRVEDNSGAGGIWRPVKVLINNVK